MPLPRRTLDVLPAVLSPECQLGACAATTSGMIPDPKQHQLSPPQPTGTRCNGVFLVCTFCQPQASETHRAVHYSASPNPNHHPNKEKPWLLCCLLGGRRLAEGGGDPPVGQRSSWQSLSRPLGRGLVPSTGAEMPSRAPQGAPVTCMEGRVSQGRQCGLCGMMHRGKPLLSNI